MTDATDDSSALLPHDNTGGQDSETELSLLIAGNEMMLTGDDSAISTYLDRLRSITGQTLRVSGVDAVSLSGMAAVVDTLRQGAGSSRGTAVVFDDRSMQLLRKHGVVPGTDGFNRMWVTDSTGLFAGQFQWKEIALPAAERSTVAVAMVIIALEAALAKIMDRLDEVQGDIDTILQLAKADLSGNILGHHQALSDLTEFVNTHGVLSEADWDSISGSRTDVQVAVEKLRAYARSLLGELATSAKPIQERAVDLDRILTDGHLEETLQLLTIAQDALYRWQRLRIERVRSTQPGLLDPTIEDARATLAANANEDGELLRLAQQALDSYGEIRPLEFMRRFSGRKLQDRVERLRSTFTDFAEARSLQIEEWADHDRPGFNDAAQELRARVDSGIQFAGHTALQAKDGILDAGATGIGRLGRKFQEIEQSLTTKAAEVDTHRAESTTEADPR